MLTVCVWLYRLLSVATSSVSFRLFANGSTLVGTLLCPPSTELDCSSATVTPAGPATKTRTVVRTVEVVHQMQTQHMRSKNMWKYAQIFTALLYIYEPETGWLDHLAILNSMHKQWYWFGVLVTCYLCNKINHTGVEVGHMSHLQYVIHTRGYNWHCVQEHFKGKVTSPCNIWWSSSTSSVQCCWAIFANFMASRRTCQVQWSPCFVLHLFSPSWTASSSLRGLSW